MFQVGKEYIRQSEIHIPFGGQRYGGISTPSHRPFMFIFTSDQGEKHGYSDGRDGKGIFHYSGEGQNGDMLMHKGNKAIKDHQKNGVTIHVFRGLNGPGGRVIYEGVAEYIDHYKAPAKASKDSDTIREAIIFKLDIDSSGLNLKSDVSKISDENRVSALNMMTLSKLREACLQVSPIDAPAEDKIKKVYYRCQAIKKYTLQRSKGICEACFQKAPFETQTGPFLEVHHVHQLSDGGPDHPENVIALCPNCHRRAHYSVDAKEFNLSLIKSVLKKERTLVTGN
jgi:5-methylcytosine-specific restriction protein A